MTAEQLQPWLGRQRSVTSVLAAPSANLMQATLSREPTLADGDSLPAGWHWLYFHEPMATAALGPDGHPPLGDLMPPVAFEDGAAPQRMWAGGELNFIRPLPIGAEAERRSTILSIEAKEGRSGQLVFVEVGHELAIAGAVCLRETQTIVYRQRQPLPPPTATGPITAEADFAQQYTPNAALLFRYSALTFNSHRIHYDVDYCRDGEQYPGLVVHGPLIATLLLDLASRRFADWQPGRFRYRSRAPLFSPTPFGVYGRDDGNLWAADGDGRLAMTATIDRNV